MNTYLVTGGEGFIGSRIVEKTAAQSFDIKSGHDILDEAALAQAVSGTKGIFHCAAKISVPESFLKKDEYERTNVTGTRSVVNAAKINNTKIVFSSSAAVYGESDKPVTETAPLNPLSPYAQNKKDAEDILSASGVNNIILRYFNVYGPGQSPEYAGVITSFIRSALQNGDITIYGDGSQVRDFIYVDDVVDANLIAMNHSGTTFDTFNVATGKSTSIKELAEKIIWLCDSSSKIRYEQARTGDIMHSCADVSKAKSILGWSPKVSLEEGLLKTIEYYRSN
jgi:UDP-glucose 4-epimerase